MRLSQFIKRNLELILQDWEDFAVTLNPLNDASRVQLRDHAKAMLLVICKDLETSQCVQEEIAKSTGNAPAVEGDTAAEAHAIDRLNSGFSIEELMAEYRAMRASVLRLWQTRVKQANQHDLQDMLRFNEAIDQALTESIARYSSLLRDSQSVFMAILSHDIRSPLGAISMGAQILLQDKELKSKHGRIATQILNSMHRANGIVSDLLDFSTTHLGSGIPVSPADVDFATACTGVVDELRLFHSKTEIVLELEGDLRVYWDSARISQALSNLVGNAIEHGLRGSTVWVTVSDAGDDIVWTVQNEGAVIDADQLRLMFDPAKRFALKSAEERNASQSGNLGLGLYITRAIVEAHKGSIRVTSTIVEGTTFLVRLPRGFPGSDAH